MLSTGLPYLIARLDRDDTFQLTDWLAEQVEHLLQRIAWRVVHVYDVTAAQVGWSQSPAWLVVWHSDAASCWYSTMVVNTVWNGFLLLCGMYITYNTTAPGDWRLCKLLAQFASDEADFKRCWVIQLSTYMYFLMKIVIQRGARHKKIKGARHKKIRGARHKKIRGSSGVLGCTSLYSYHSVTVQLLNSLVLAIDSR